LQRQVPVVMDSFAGTRGGDLGFPLCWTGKAERQAALLPRGRLISQAHFENRSWGVGNGSIPRNKRGPGTQPDAHRSARFVFQIRHRVVAPIMNLPGHLDSFNLFRMQCRQDPGLFSHADAEEGLSQWPAGRNERAEHGTVPEGPVRIEIDAPRVNGPQGQPTLSGFTLPENQAAHWFLEP